jgi:hypothetical protein
MRTIKLPSRATRCIISKRRTGRFLLATISKTGKMNIASERQEFFEKSYNKIGYTTAAFCNTYEATSSSSCGVSDNHETCI